MFSFIFRLTVSLFTASLLTLPQPAFLSCLTVKVLRLLSIARQCVNLDFLHNLWCFCACKFFVHSCSVWADAPCSCVVETKVCSYFCSPYSCIYCYSFEVMWLFGFFSVGCVGEDRKTSACRWKNMIHNEPSHSASIKLSVKLWNLKQPQTSNLTCTCQLMFGHHLVCFHFPSCVRRLKNKGNQITLDSNLELCTKLHTSVMQTREL